MEIKSGGKLEMSDEGLIVIMSVLSGHHPALVSSQSQRSFCLTTLPQDLRTFYVLNAKPGMNYEQHQNANQNWIITCESCKGYHVLPDHYFVTMFTVYCLVTVTLLAGHIAYIILFTHH